MAFIPKLTLKKFSRFMKMDQHRSAKYFRGRRRAYEIAVMRGGAKGQATGWSLFKRGMGM